MNQILEDARQPTPEMGEVYDEVFQACDTCGSPGNPISVRKILLTHVNSAFKIEGQAAFFNFYDKQQKIWNFERCGNRYKIWGTKSSSQARRHEYDDTVSVWVDT